MWVPFEIAGAADRCIHAGLKRRWVATQQTPLFATLGLRATPFRVGLWPQLSSGHVHLSGCLVSHPRLLALLRRAEADAIHSASLFIERWGPGARFLGFIRWGGARAARGVRKGVCPPLPIFTGLAPCYEAVP